MPEPTEAPLPAPLPVPSPSSTALKLKLYYVGTTPHQFVMELSPDGTNIVDLAELGYSHAKFNIDAVPNGDSTVGSVVFDNGIVENTSPYIYCAHSGSLFYTCSDLIEGLQTVSATAYPEKHLSGTPYETFTAIIDIRGAQVPEPISDPAFDSAPDSASDYTWKFLAPLPIEMGEASSVSDGTYVYMVSGHGNSWENVKDLWRYDPATDSWDKRASQNVVKNANHVMAQCFNGKIYLLCGFAPEHNEVAIYDIATDTWSAGTPLTLEDGSPFNVGSSASGVVNGKIYVAGGLHNDNKDGETIFTFVYDPEDGPGGSWTQLADMPADDARNHPAGVGYNGKFYVFAGRRGPNGNRPGIKTSLVYDPSVDEWSYIADIPTVRAGMGAAVELFGELYVIGGEQPGVLESVVEAYNPETNTWSTKQPLQVGRHGHYPVKLGNTIHVVAGGDEAGFDYCDIHEVYSPA